MSRYIIGDIHGCYLTLQKLLAEVSYDSAVDELWLTGDLVQRGPASERVLDWAIDNQVNSVLGNHDMHLLMINYFPEHYFASAVMHKTLDSPRLDEYCQWIANLPLCIEIDDMLLVHAGVNPRWNRAQILSAAQYVSDFIAGDERLKFLNEAYGEQNQAPASTESNSYLYAQYLLNTFTRMRYCDSEGKLWLVEPYDEAKAAESGVAPWYSFLSEVEYRKIVFGHWSSLGHFENSQVLCLDGGCNRGGSLCAYLVDEGRVIAVPNCD